MATPKTAIIQTTSGAGSRNRFAGLGMWTSPVLVELIIEFVVGGAAGVIVIVVG